MPWPTANPTFQGGIKAVLKGRMHSQETNNIFWFVLPGELGTPDWPAILMSIGQAILECAVTHLLPGLSSDYLIEEIRVTRMSTPDKLEIIVPADAGSQGALGAALPVHNSGVLQWRTPFGGKSWRGRSGFAGITEEHSALSLLGPIPVAALGAFAVCMLQKFQHDLGTLDPVMVIFSRKLGFVSPSTYNFNANTIAPVNSFAVRLPVGTINSRKLGRGA